MRQESRRRRAVGLRPPPPPALAREPPGFGVARAARFDAAPAALDFAFAWDGFFAGVRAARVVLRGRFGGGERRRLAIWLRRAEA